MKPKKFIERTFGTFATKTDETIKNKLVPCPGCGDNSYIILFSNPPWEWFQCGNCGWTSGLDLGDGMAIKNWNHRVYPPEIQAVLTTARDYLFKNCLSSRRPLRTALTNLEEMKAKNETQ